MAETEDWIEKLSLWKASKGKKTKSDYFTILSWARKDANRFHQVTPAVPHVPMPEDPEYMEQRIGAIHRMFERDFANGLRKDVPTLEDIRQILRENP
jgi:hypothetical protein